MFNMEKRYRYKIIIIKEETRSEENSIYQLHDQLVDSGSF